MGCHTWFATKGDKDIRTDDEIRDYLIKVNKEACTREVEYPYWQKYYRRVSKLIPKFSKRTINIMLWYEDSVFDGYFYKDVEEFHDVFRVPDYLEDILTCTEAVHDFLYTNKIRTSQSQRDKLVQFFREHSDGIIYFG